MANVKSLRVLCPASDAVGLPRCAQAFEAKWVPKLELFEGECPKHGAVRLLPGLAEKCAGEAEAAPKAAAPAKVKGKSKGKGKAGS